MARFPFFREVAGEQALVVGGGAVALRRARTLADFGADVLAVAPAFCEDFEKLSIRCERRAFEMSDLVKSSIVVAATDDRVLNAQIGNECRARGIEVNVADDPSACTFHFPGIVRRGALTVGISTGGASPAVSAFVREHIEETLPDRLEDILACMDKSRSLVRERIGDQKVRSKILKNVFEYCLTAESVPDERTLEDVIRQMEMD